MASTAVYHLMSVALSISLSDDNQMEHCKIRGFRGGDYEERSLLGCSAAQCVSVASYG
jgi:hypothetical protein